MGYTESLMAQSLPDLRIYERANSIADLYRLAAQSYGDLPAQARRERGGGRRRWRLGWLDEIADPFQGAIGRIAKRIERRTLAAPLVKAPAGTAE